jgi:metallophosphoesterase superfamily enzyme
VHAAEGAARAEQFMREATVPIVLLAGNHDRRWRSAGEQTLRRGNWFFHHGDRAPAVPEGCTEIIGHHHPAIGWSDGAGARFKRPALVASRRRLILPAFSPWAAGTPWNDSLAAGDTLWIVAPNRIFALPTASFAGQTTPPTAG